MIRPPIPPTYSEEKAAKLGFRSITMSYDCSDRTDREYLSRVLFDMININHCIIKTTRGVEVGRLKVELL
jgi:hypothetical protein